MSDVGKVQNLENISTAVIFVFNVQLIKMIFEWIVGLFECKTCNYACLLVLLWNECDAVLLRASSFHLVQSGQLGFVRILVVAFFAQGQQNNCVQLSLSSL